MKNTTAQLDKALSSALIINELVQEIITQTYNIGGNLALEDFSEHPIEQILTLCDSIHAKASAINMQIDTVIELID